MAVRNRNEVPPEIAEIIRNATKDAAGDMISESVAKQLAAATRALTPEQQLTKDLLAKLDEIGEARLGDEDILFYGTKMILPASMEGNLHGVIDVLEQRIEDDEQEHSFERTFPYRPYDGAAAFARAMMRVFGVMPGGRVTVTFFGRKPPTYQTIPIDAYGATMQVPWGKFEMKFIDSVFEIGATEGDSGYVSHISVKAPRKQRKRIEAFLTVVEDELQERSIYRGHAITGDSGIEVKFFDHKTQDVDEIVYTQEVIEALQANLWTPIRHAPLMRDLRQPLRRAVLLEGPNGTGKTSAGTVTAHYAVENGFTFVLVRQGEDAFEAIKTASLYSPAVVWIEDLDTEAAGKSRSEIAELLDALDNVGSKRTEIIACFTSNFPEVIDKGVLRPGRIDAVIHVGALDRPGVEKLMRYLIPRGMLAQNVDFDAVAAESEGYLPAFLTEVAKRTILYAINREGGRPETVTTDDLVKAARDLKPQLALHEGNTATKDVPDPLATEFRKMVAETIQDHKVAGFDADLVPRNGNGRH